MGRFLGGLVSRIIDTPRRASRFSLLLITTGAFTSICEAQPAVATLNIQLDKPVHAVSPTLYGLMTEEINYSYDGGLYAEMVRNRTFQDHGFGGVAHWNIEHRGNSIASMAIDPAEGPSAALEHSLAIDVKQADPPDRPGYETRAIGAWLCGPIRPTKDRCMRRRILQT